jgi:multidrug efflux pump subunit AcrB
MMGFIMVLGMLVDDAIIVGENITYHMEQGRKPREAAVIGALELIGPVTATVMTTIIAFLPMMFMAGVIGKFVIAIPIVVITLLFFSWLESFLVLPAHVADVARPQVHPKERAWITWIERAYAGVLRIALKLRWLTVLLSILLLIGSIVLASKSSFQLFPNSAVDQLLVRVTAAGGTSLDEMRKKMRLVDQAIRDIVPEQYLETTIVSNGQIQFDAGDPLMQRGSRYAQIRVLYTPAVSRPEHNAMNDLRSIENQLPELFPELEFSFSEVKGGPPTGRALQVEIGGDDSDISAKVAQNLMDFLATVKGVKSIESGVQPGDDEIHVVLDREMAAYAGVDLATAASHVRAAVDGLRVSTIRRGTEEIDVTIRFPQKKNQLDVLKQLRVPNQRGGLVPLAKIAKFEEHTGYSTVRHKDGIRVVFVLANVDPKIITSESVNKLVAENEKDWVGQYGDEVTVRYGGEQEKTQESVFGLMISFGFALIGIFFILAIQFNKLSYPFFVMLAIPFGAIGVIISFYLHDKFWQPTPLSFFALMGMVALSGVVVNSSLVLLVFVQRALDSGMHYLEAIMQAGRRRIRAVMLTAATTVAGLLPTAYGWGGSDPFVAPMALALSSGLIFATVITLITIPASFAVGMDIKFFIIKIWRKIFPKKENKSDSFAQQDEAHQTPGD